MLTTTPLLSVLVCSWISFAPGTYANRGKVVAAPHGGYDQQTEVIAREVAQRLDWGWVTAVGYRSEPLRFWYDVNRPTERPWSYGGFGDSRYTTRAQAVFAEYMQKVGQAARQQSGRLGLIVEMHGHSRRVSTSSGSSFRVEAIELATTGFTRTELRRIERRYDELVAQLPSHQRVPLAIDDLHDPYEYDGWLIPFYFHASEARQEGSLNSSVTERSLHFELPRAVRIGYSNRQRYVRLLADLLETAVD